MEQIRTALNNLTRQDIISAEVSRELLTTIDRFQANTTPRSRGPFETSPRQATDDPIADDTPAGPSFSELLKQFAGKSIAYLELEEGLIADLDADPSNHDDYVSALQQLVAQQIISEEVFANLMAALEISDEEVEPAQKEVEETSEVFELVEDDSEFAREDIESNHQDIESNHQDLDSIQEDLDSIQEDLDSIQEDLDSAEEDDERGQVDIELAEEDNELAEEDVELAEEDNELAEEDNELAEEDNELVEEDNELVEEDNELVEEDNELVEEDNELAEEDNAPAQDDLDRDQEDVELGQQDIEPGREDVEVAQDDIASAQNDVDQAQEDAAPDEDDVDQAQDNVDQAQDNVDQAQDNVDQAQDNVDQAQDDVGRAQDDVGRAQEDVGRAQEVIELDQEDVAPAQEDVDQAQDEFELAQQDTAPAEDDVDQAQEDSELAQEDIAPAQEDVDQAQEELKLAQEDIASAQDDVDKAQDDVDREREDLVPAEDGPKQDRQDIDRNQVQERGLHAVETSQQSDDVDGDTTRPMQPSASADNLSEPLEDEGAVPIGTLLQNRFRITELIGHGGTGSVYKAEDQVMVAADDRLTEVAVKVLNKSFHEHPEAFQILHREALKTRSLAHPNIVNVFDCDRDENTIFMTMELMHGLRLDDALPKNPDGFEFEDAKRFIVEMADALKNAHKGGMIHSDLRPGNIFLANGTIKLFDFGMARAIRQGGAETTIMRRPDTGEVSELTPAYASPEMVANSAEPDPRDDIYAMGCLACELLTGKHPFVVDGKKVSATMARKRGLKPAHIPRLKSWQWNAIKGCLEFERSKRTGEVSIFLDEFLQERGHLDVRKLAVGAVAAVLIPLLVVFGWDYANKRDVGEFNALVNQGVEHELIRLRIDEIQKMGVDAQYTYFHARTNQNDLMNYYQQRTDALIALDDFELAQPLIDQALALYPDSSRINSVLNDFNAKRNLRINDLDGKLNSLLADADTFVSQYLQLEQIWQTFAKVDDDYPTDISSRSVIMKLEDTARGLMTEGNHGAATEMAQFGLALFSNDPDMLAQLAALENLTGSIENKQGRQQRSQQLAAVESTLSALGSDSSLDELQAAREQIVRLNDLSPDSEILLRIRSTLTERLSEAVEQELKEQRWQSAQARIESFVDVLTVKQQELLRESVDSQRNAYRDRAAELQRQITLAARSDDPGSAMAYLDQLRDFDANSPEIAASADLIGTGWLKQARIQKAKENWQIAQTYVQSGLTIAKGDVLRTALQSELVAIEQSKQRAGKQLELAEANRREQQKKQRIQQLEKRVGAVVNDSPLTSKGSLAALELLDQLEIEDSSNALITSGKQQLVARYQKETRRLVTAGKLEQALQMSQLGFSLLPDQTVLADEIEEVKRVIADQQAAVQQQQLAGLQDELTRLSEQFDLTTDPDHLVQTLQRYESSHESDGLSEYVRFKAAAAFVKLAESRIAAARFEDAEEAISQARRFDPGYAQIPAVEEKVRRGDLENRSIKKDQRLKAQLASMQQSFITQVQALDVRSATTTLAAIKQGKLAPTDPFYTSTVPTEFERAYLRLAALRASPSTVAETIGLLETGLAYKADSSLLRSRLDIYRQAQRILTTSAADPEQATRMLRKAKEQYPKEQIFQNLKITAGPQATAPATDLDIEEIHSYAIGSSGITTYS